MCQTSLFPIYGETDQPTPSRMRRLTGAALWPPPFRFSCAPPLFTAGAAVTRRRLCRRWLAVLHGARFERLALDVGDEVVESQLPAGLESVPITDESKAPQRIKKAARRVEMVKEKTLLCTSA